MALFRLFSAPLPANVVFTHDAVIWRATPRYARLGSAGKARVMSYHIASGRNDLDLWLSRLFSYRKVDSWAVRGRRVVWIDTTQRSMGAAGSVRVGSRVFTTVRSATPLTPPSWGSSSDTGEYEPGQFSLAFDGKLAVWYDMRYRRGAQGSRMGRDAGLYVCRVDDRRVLRVPAGANDELLTLGGSVVFYGPRLAAASNGGTRAVACWDAATGRRWSIRLDRRAAGPAAADARTLVWTSVPAGATDFVDAYVAGCDLWSGRRFSFAAEGVSSTDPTVSGRLVAFVETAEGGTTPDVQHIVVRDLRAPAAEFRLVDPCADAPPSDLTLVGRRLFWTLWHGGRVTVYGAQLSADGNDIVAEPLRP